MIRLLVLAAIAVALCGPGRAGLVRARWTERTPRAAILLWQAVALAAAIAVIGACVELALLATPGVPRRARPTDFTSTQVATVTARSLTPEELFALTAGLIVVTLVFGASLARTLGLLRRHARQRLLVDLVASESPELPGALVIASPDPAVFAVPRLRQAQVVLSSGALELLDPSELSAVLAHERAHLRARHDLALLPFRLLATLLPRWRSVQAVRTEVGTLLDMAADDHARRDCAPEALARALCRLAPLDAAPRRDVAPRGPARRGPARRGRRGGRGPSATDAVLRRVERVLGRPPTQPGGPLGALPHARLVACQAALAAMVVVAAPLATLVVPQLGRT